MKSREVKINKTPFIIKVPISLPCFICKSPVILKEEHLEGVMVEKKVVIHLNCVEHNTEW